jgi:tellurite resistance protein TerC
MSVPVWLWIATVGGLLVLLAIDLVIVDHKPHKVGIAEAARWVTFYIAVALGFAVLIWLMFGGMFAGEYLAGYITEYSLSVDNLFIFVILMSSFKVPVVHQHRVLLVGIVIALIMRGLFIAAGAAVIAQFSWVFYLFGLFLIYTAYNLARQGNDHEGDEDNAALRLVRKLSDRLPVTEDYRGSKSFVKEAGKRMVTPMLIVMIAIGATDLLFALDSIPAIFGLTKEPFLVFAANAFALMGLRQLYFLLGGLLQKLIYLSFGLALILGFIGVKLILEALHENSLPFLNDGQSVPVPTISTVLSLSVIVGVLVITTVASLLRTRNMSDEQLAEKGLPTRENGRQAKDSGQQRESDQDADQESEQVTRRWR